MLFKLGFFFFFELLVYFLKLVRNLNVMIENILSITGFYLLLNMQILISNLVNPSLNPLQFNGLSNQSGLILLSKQQKVIWYLPFINHISKYCLRSTGSITRPNEFWRWHGKYVLQVDMSGILHICQEKNFLFFLLDFGLSMCLI